MRKELAQAVSHLPRPLRRKSYLAHLRFKPDEIASLTFKLAETRSEREQAFALLHDMYVRRGLLDRTPSGLKLSVYSLLPTTAIFIGVRDGRVLSTMSLIEDSPLGLPMEEIYTEELDRLRLPGRRIAEVGALAVATGARGKGLALMMYNLMFRWAHFCRGIDDLVIAVNPRAQDFYATLLLFERIGGARTYETLKRAPAVALRLDLTTGVSRYRKIYDADAKVGPGRKPVSNLFRFFYLEEFANLTMPVREKEIHVSPPAWDPADVSHFLDRQNFDAATLNSEQRRFLFAQYPHLAPSSDAPVDFGARASEYRSRRLPSETLLAAAVKAPSGDNTQPWRFAVDHREKRIAVFLEEARDRSPMNAGQRMARIAIGGALENLVRTIAANGWAAEAEEIPAKDSTRPLAVLRLTDTGRVSGEIEAVVAARVTNRRVYEGRALPAETAARLSRQTSPREGVRTHWILGPDRVAKMASLISRADATAIAEPPIREAFYSRVRFDKAHDAEVAEGLSVDSLELSAFERLALKMVPRTPDWMLRFTGAFRSYAAHVKKLVESASGLCLIVAPDNREETDLLVGRAMQRAWLALTAEGLAAQPMMSLLVLENLLEQGPPALSADLERKNASRLTWELRKLAPEIGRGRPAFLLRFGYAAAPTGRTGRLRPEWVTTRTLPAAPAKPAEPVPAIVSGSGKRARQRVLFVAEAVEPASLARSVALASRLDPDRYEVILASDPRYQALYPAPPFPVRQIHSISSERFLQALASGSPLYDAETLSAYVKEDLEVIRETSPDVVVGAFRLSLAVSARRARVPYLTIAEACWSPYARQRIPLADHASVKYVGTAIPRMVFSAVRPFALAYHCRPLNRVLQQHRMPSLGTDLRRVFTEADATLYPDIPELWPGSPMPPNHHYLGAMPWSPPAELPAWWNEVPSDKPIVSVTLGSMGKTELWPAIAEALGELPVSVIAATAGRSGLTKVPENMFVTDVLPGENAMARASLLICDGGSQTAYPALEAGVPVLGLAGNMTQLLTIGAIARAGAGEWLRAGSVESATLRAAVVRMLDRPSYSEAAARLASAFARYDAVARLQDLLTSMPARSAAVA